MYKLYQVIILCVIFLFLFLMFDLCGASNDTAARHRQRRYLSFRNTTHFFVRFNFKANMVPWNQIFAQAVGFRMNWDDPPDTFHPYRHFLYRRSIYNNIEMLINRNGLDGFHCVRRAVCEVGRMAEPHGLYHKILQMVFRRQSSLTDNWHNTTEVECLKSISTCPFSVFDISLYTDL